MFKRISIIGDGAMGTLLAALLCEKDCVVRIWGHDSEYLKQMAAAGENIKFLPGYKLPDSLLFEADDAAIMSDAELIVSAVPCQFVRSVWTRLKDYYPESVPVVSITKGIENDTLLRPTEILKEILGESLSCVALSGPTIVDELARHLPAVACAACSDEKLAKKVQQTFNTSWLRVYTNTDVVGVELAGAMKNIIAIAAGIIDGIGAGDNAKAALLSRGLAEITRLGVAMGANGSTFAGLTGLGDLVTTCISPMGRNRSFGEMIGKGKSVQQAQQSTESVIEGVATCKSVFALAGKLGIEIPITQAIHEVLFEGKSVQKAIDDLMTRQLKAE